MKREYKDYVKDILDSIEKIELFVKDIKNIEDFSNDEKTILAIEKLLENIGEAVKKIPKSVKDKYHSIQWQEIAGMRDILIHEYFGVDYEVVWKTIKEDIPAIKPMFQKIWNDK